MVLTLIVLVVTAVYTRIMVRQQGVA
jgi:hypothetical protein